jgi:hypothetical protein
LITDVDAHNCKQVPSEDLVSTSLKYLHAL